MNNSYIQEPATHGKVLLETTVGDIDIELWSREAPKAVRNFVQLCMEGYYDGTLFHRLVKGFIVQGGDPTGTGQGGSSIWGTPFKDEIHSSLRFVRRGLVAMANAGRDDNSSQFFFTLGTTPELQNKQTIFGTVGGDTIYNMLKLGEGIVGEDERPLYPHKILRTRILTNPFDDIIPRQIVKPLSGTSSTSATKEEVATLNQKFTGKSKSSNDPKLTTSDAATETVIPLVDLTLDDEVKMEIDESEEEIVTMPITPDLTSPLMVLNLQELEQAFRCAAENDTLDNLIFGAEIEHIQHWENITSISRMDEAIPIIPSGLEAGTAGILEPVVVPEADFANNSGRPDPVVVTLRGKHNVGDCYVKLRRLTIFLRPTTRGRRSNVVAVPVRRSDRIKTFPKFPFGSGRGNRWQM